MAASSVRLTSFFSDVRNAKLRYKLEDLISSGHFNRSIDTTQLLLQASRSGILHLQIPETLIPGIFDKRVFLFTDADGVVRTMTGKDAQDAFMQVCGSKTSAISDSIPQGLVFPKYLSFSSKAPLAFYKQNDLKRFLKNSFTKVQRYIIPHDLIVRKLLLRWRRTKETKVYSVTSVLPLKVKKQSVTSNQCGEEAKPFLASVKDLDSCKFKREMTVPDDVFRCLRTVLEVLQATLSSPSEQVEECLVSLIRGVNGVLYFIDSPYAKVVPVAAPQGPIHGHSQSVTLPRIRSVTGLEKMQEVKHMISRRLSMKRGLGANTLKLNSVRPKSFVPSQVASASAMNTAIEALDGMREKTKARKDLSEFFQSLKSREAKDGFLQNCVREMYERVSTDSKLARFFRREPPTFHHIRTSVTQVFLEGKHISRIREIHRHLGVTDADFERYLKHFGDAFRSEGGSEQHVQLAVGFLRTFESQIVTKKAPASMESSMST